MSSLSRWFSLASLWLSAVGLVGMTIIIGWQVFARYVLRAAPSWTEQGALFLMLWFILFAAAAGVREGFHIRVSILRDSVGDSVAKFLSLLSHFIVLIFGVFMVVGSTQLVIATWQHTIPTLGLPRGSAYIPIAGAGLLIAFFSIEHLISEIKGKEIKPLWS